MHLLVVLLAVAIVDPEPPVEVAKLDVGQSKKVEIVRQETAKKGTELTVVLNPKDDQFTVDFDFDGAEYRYVKILVKGATKWDTVRYFPTVKHSVGKTYLNLLTMRGVNVEKKDNDCAIEFTTPSALKLLPPGGRLVFRFASGAALHLNSGPGGTKVTPKSKVEATPK